MTDSPTLTLAFLAHAPASAAQVLEDIAAGEAAAFLEEIPARIAAPAIACMSPWSAARCIERLTPHRAAAILQSMHFHDCAGLMRLLSGEGHATIIDALPARLSKRLRNALRYPPGSVGAWIDPEIPAFAEQAPVGEALRYVADAGGVSHVFLHSGDDGRFSGAVPVTALMRAGPGRALSDMPLARIRALSSRDTLASVAFLDEWDDYLMLPVIGRNRSLVGGLSRASLRKGLLEQRSAPEVIPGTLTGQLLSALAITCTGLVRIVAGTDTSQGKERHHA